MQGWRELVFLVTYDFFWSLVDLSWRRVGRAYECIRTKILHTRLAEFMTTRSAAECQRKCAEMKNNFSAF